MPFTPLRFLLAIAAALCLAAGSTVAAGGAAAMELRGQVAIDVGVESTAVEAAAADLARDFGWVLGSPALLGRDPSAPIAVRIDPALGAAEAYRIDVAADRATIAGADELGAVYGLYHFSQEFLGVDPYWFFKDARPARREVLRIEPCQVRSRPSTFRFRGWFVNDEDLLTEWKDGGGTRHIDYPFYGQVVRLDVLERVFEALLRTEGNLVIPASFVDVMNEPEARLVRRAAERGLYVTQHHIEPLGVSHFGFENYWKARGQKRAFSYGSHPDWVRQAWRDYAARWIELAGDHVVWQLGLRGKGDRAIWQSDSSVDQAAAGRFISQAIADQWEIVRSLDSRPDPPATTTLWAEGSQLMQRGQLTFPEGVTVVFADEGSSQTMQADFRQAARQPGRTYGVYYHVGFWNRGPHLLQGARPDRVKRVFDEVVAHGDTQYAIVNVCNVREHVLGIQAASELMKDHAGWSEADFWNRFAPPVLQPSYRALLASLVELEDDALLQDGTAFVAAGHLMRAIASGKGGLSKSYRPKGVSDDQGYVEMLSAAIARLDDVAAGYPADKLTPAQRKFYDVHLLAQAKQLREVYAYLRALLQSQSDPTHLPDAEAALFRLLDARTVAAHGKWADWYRGDKKVNVPNWLARTRELKEKKLPDGT